MLETIFDVLMHLFKAFIWLFFGLCVIALIFLIPFGIFSLLTVLVCFLCKFEFSWFYPQVATIIFVLYVSLVVNGDDY